MNSKVFKNIQTVCDNYLTTREAATMLGISVRTAQQWVEKGRLEGWKTGGGHRRIRRNSVLQLISDRCEKSVTGQSWKVLIVEDDASILKLYRLRLSRWPFDVTIYTASNGYEGLLMVGEALPDLLICDLRLPGVNGFQIVRAICNVERYNSMAIAVVSGLPIVEIEAHGGVPSRVDLITKPIDFHALQAIAEGTVYRRDARLQPETK